MPRVASLPRARKMKGRSSCLPACFSGASVWVSDELEPPPFDSPESFLSHLRSRRRTAPLLQIAGDGGEGPLAFSGEITREGGPSGFSPMTTPNRGDGDGLTQKDRKEERRTKITIQHISQSPLTTRAHGKAEHPQQSRCHASTCNSPNQALGPLQPVQTGFRTSHPEASQPSRPAHPTQQPTPAARHLGAAAGLAMMVASFAVMLLFGRLYAVLCNCALFYFLSCIRQPPPPQPETETDCMEEVDVDSPEYKKKVVLMGLLERNHHRVSGNPWSPMTSPASQRGS